MYVCEREILGFWQSKKKETLEIPFCLPKCKRYSDKKATVCFSF